MNKRIVITGIGLVSPIGTGINEFSASLKEGRSKILPVKSFDTSFLRSKKASEVDNFEAKNFIKNKNIRKMDRISQFAVSASVMAVEDSGLPQEELKNMTTAVVLGTAAGPSLSTQKFFLGIENNGRQLANPIIFPNISINMAAGLISIELEVKGPNSTVSTEGASGMNAIFYAMNLIKSGKADICLAGGAEEMSLLNYAYYSLRGDLATAQEQLEECSIPFDKRRNGFILGEGACIFVLESYENAVKRGAKMYAEILAIDSMSYNKSKGLGKALLKTMKTVTDTAGIIPGAISACANSSIVIDQSEEFSIKQAFEGRANDIMVSPVKSLIGETVGAGGPFSIASAILNNVSVTLINSCSFDSVIGCGSSVSLLIRKCER